MSMLVTRTPSGVSRVSHSENTHEESVFPYQKKITLDYFCILDSNKPIYE